MLTEHNIQQAKQAFVQVLRQRAQHAMADEVAKNTFIIAEDGVMEVVLHSAYAQHIFQQLAPTLRHFLAETLPPARNYRLRSDFTPAQPAASPHYFLPSEVYEIMRQKYPLIHRFKENMGFDVSG